MKYTQLGRTNMNVSVIGLGGASLGGVYQKTNNDSAIKTVHTALNMGVNFIDVAPYYGLTKAESVLGEALRHPDCPMKREQYYIATKVGRYGMDKFDFSAERVTKGVEESLERLGLEYIDLIQCHDIEFTNLEQIANETLPALYKLKESGKVRNIGITGFPLKIFRGVLEKLDDSSQLVDTVLSYCHYSLNNNTLEQEIPYLKSKNVGIINASALSMGLLCKHGPPEWHPASPEIKEYCNKAVKYCFSRGHEIERLALLYSLSNSDIHTTLVGTASVEEVTNNINCANDYLEHGFSHCDLRLMKEVQDLLKPIQSKSWSSGLPENN